MEAKDLKAACRKFEHEHGVEAFLDALADVRAYFGVAR